MNTTDTQRKESLPRKHRTQSAWVSRSQAQAAAARRTRPKVSHQGPLSRAINQWWDRLIRSITHREYAAVEVYDAGRTSRDYVWNSLGLGIWGVQLPLLTIIITWLAGVEAAGRFSIAYATAMMLMYIGNYGVRTFQVSDVHEEQSFAAYQIVRIFTCALMALCGYLWCLAHSYDSQMLAVCYGVIGYRLIDAMADVYEGRLQQCDKLYIAGISITLRSTLTTLVCTLFLAVTHDLGIACIALFFAALVTLILFTLPIALLETPVSRKPALIELREIVVQCFPAAAALFLYTVIDNLPKFAMEGVLSYDNQLYYNAIYIPAHAIVMIVGFVYKPQLMRLATVWADPRGRRKFDLIIVAVLAMVAGITAVMGLIMAIVGIRLLSMLYGVDFEQFKVLVFAMVAAGGLAAAVDFLYQIITVLRQQASVTPLYAIGFLIALPLSWLLVHFFGLPGSVYAALSSMALLLVLLAARYISLRRSV